MNLPPVKVFISYAWESDELRQGVAALAKWLQDNSTGRVKVTTDHLYSHRPPRVGWPTWMADQIEESDVVLIVCTSTYLTRFRKKEEPGKGRGAIYEGAIITQELINGQTINDKFFPIVPDGGDLNYIPTLLQQFFNGHFFPSGNKGILKMVLNENPTYDQVIITQFFEAASVDEQVKESLANDIQTKINAEIAKEILGLFVPPKDTKGANMLSPLQNTIRAFLSLNDFDKLNIVKGLGIEISQLNNENVIERDKQIFKLISERQLIASLWSAVNQVKSFGTETNPFIK